MPNDERMTKPALSRRPIVDEFSVFRNSGFFQLAFARSFYRDVDISTSAGEESRRDSVLQPRVARDELPWVRAGEEPATPTGLWLEDTANIGTTPLGLSVFARFFPRVARPSQPWALSRNPFGIP